MFEQHPGEAVIFSRGERIMAFQGCLVARSHCCQVILPGSVRLAKKEKGKKLKNVST